MRTIGAKLDSHRVSVFEALANHNQRGLTIPDIVRISGVASSTVHRVIDDYRNRDIVQRTGEKDGKAPFYRLNSKDYEVVEAARCFKQYTARIADIESQIHGSSSFLGGDPTSRSSITRARLEGSFDSHPESETDGFRAEFKGVPA